MIKAIRLTEESVPKLDITLVVITLEHAAAVGDLIVSRPNDTIVMTPEQFDYQYEFIHPESSDILIECRVKDTPEARAELLEIQESRDEMILEITTVVKEECPYDYVPHDVIEIITNHLIEKGWRAQ